MTVQAKSPPSAYSPWSVNRVTAIVDGVDAVAASMEAKWGVGRLRLLVDDDLRERFDRQRRKFNKAIWSGELADIERQADGMRKGWQALDRAAEQAGARPLAPEVWEVRLDDGKVAALVRTAAEAHKVAREGRYLAVYTLDEIARLIQAYPEVARAKEVFPGALVEDVRARAEDIDWEVGDALPI